MKFPPVRTLLAYATACQISILIFQRTAGAQAVRAAYNFRFGSAWSATVDLPRYDLLDLGPVGTPVDVNDSGTVLLRDPSNRLVKWTWGDLQVLWQPFFLSQQGFINNTGTVAISDANQSYPRLLYWFDNDTSPAELDVASHLVARPHFLTVFGLNDLDSVVFRADASDNLFFVPETRQQETNIVSLQTGSWREITRYTYFLDTDFSLTHGGQLYNVGGFNNYEDTIGIIYEGSGSSSPGNPDPDGETYDNIYYSLNVEYALDFEPMAISDSRTILGATPSPLAGMVILDKFGQRYIGPLLSELDSMRPSMSSAANGLEEIVIGPHYFKRMSECDIMGISNGVPAPDFWHGSLTDIIAGGSPMLSPEATCISASGRIAGTGWVYDPTTRLTSEHAFLLVDPILIPDWDRNGKIDAFDREYSQRGEAWRFWINDDDDEGELARSSADDHPGSPVPDWDNDSVDGLRDVVDFFPVHIDAHQILKSIGSTGNVQIRIRQADTALNVLLTRLGPLEAGNIHKQPFDGGFGPDFTQPLPEATVAPVGPDGVLLPPAFLQQILEHDQGVLLFEANRVTSKPLVMELIHNGSIVLKSSLQLSISPVESMMRILNLRNADPKFATDPGPWPTHLEEPPNLPDAFLKSLCHPQRTLLHIHGFNWTGEEIPAAHSEVFKRFYQAGSNARFIGVSWHGDAGTMDITGSSFEYNENVIHAFMSARYLAELLAPFSGPYTSIFAHSLGNMVASSAIVDFGFHVRNYFMTNAAVALEAYLGETLGRRHMVHPDWKDEGYLVTDYAEYLIAPNWHRLFPDDDHRSLLKWKNRFRTISQSTFCYNFYSTGEDVLRTGTGDLPNLFADVANKEWVWVFNEMVKGTNTFVANLSGDVHGGWGFNRYWMDWVDPGGAAHPPPGSWVEISPEEADLISSADLIEQPFFHRFSSGDEEFPEWNEGDWLYGSRASANASLPSLPLVDAPMEQVMNHAKIIAEAIPAHSAPTGSQPIPSLLLLDNIDLDSTVRQPIFWPMRDDPDRRNRWLHSDYMQPAFAHTWKFFNLCIKQINRMP